VGRWPPRGGVFEQACDGGGIVAGKRVIAAFRDYSGYIIDGTASDTL
jgi:hypothetical protein